MIDMMIEDYDVASFGVIEITAHLIIIISI